jgi:hypothetical protein
MCPGAEETGTECVPRAEEMRVGEMEGPSSIYWTDVITWEFFFYGPVNTTGPWIAQYVGLSTKITTEEARCMRTVCVFYYCRTYYK